MTSFGLIFAIFTERRRHFYQGMRLTPLDVTKCCNAGTRSALRHRDILGMTY